MCKKKSKYDIFISYRRKDTGDKAEHLKDLLEKEHYRNVSFDRENLTGLFDVELAKRIDQCKDFLLVIGKKSLSFDDADFDAEKIELYNYLGKCSQKEFAQKIHELGPNAPIDFVRIEIARALNREKVNIIPIVPESSDSFKFCDLNLPDDIVKIKRYEAIFFSDNPDALFKDIVPKLKSHLGSKPASIWQKIILYLAVFLLALGIGVFLWSYFTPQTDDPIEKSELLNKLEEKHKILGLKLSSDLTIKQMNTIDTILMNMVSVPPDSFWISKYEFTVGHWHDFLGETFDESQRHLPKTEISYGEVYMTLINDLSSVTNISFNLPSSDEWEYAAHGGINQEKTIYVGSDDIDSVAWYKNNSGGKVHPSNGQQGKLPNSIDLYDMSGNVSEMCNSSFSINGDNILFTKCGGNYNSPANEATVKSRTGYDLNAKDKTLGFRLIIQKRD